MLTHNGKDANLGIWDGFVRYEQINHVVCNASSVEILFGDQTRLPYFPNDRRLSKLHSGELLVLQVWKVLEKIPENLRNVPIDLPISITISRTPDSPYFRDVRCHQAAHIGRRRRTVYMSEQLLAEAAEKGYDHWAVAEGIIFATWTLLDYLLLVEVFKSYVEIVGDLPNYRFGENLLLKLAGEHNRQRCDSIDLGRSELGEFVAGYKDVLLQLWQTEALDTEPFELECSVFDHELEEKWPQEKMERVAKIFNYPRFFLFDRDIIHDVAHEAALRKGQDTVP